VAVSICWEDVPDVRQYHPLEALGDDWGQGDWAVVVEAGDCGLFWDRDNGGGFKAGVAGRG